MDLQVRMPRKQLPAWQLIEISEVYEWFVLFQTRQNL